MQSIGGKIALNKVDAFYFAWAVVGFELQVTRHQVRMRVTNLRIDVRNNLDPRALLLTEREKSSGEP